MREAALPALRSSVRVDRARIQSLFPPLLLCLAFAAVLLIVPPLGEFPVSDDWVHTRAVLSLLERGTPEISPWASASLALQLYWGALFVHLFGFSFIALRASTLVLSAAGLFGCYVLLRDLVEARWALLASLLLLFNPLYVYFSYSFMTEVPFICLSLWALVCYRRALKSSKPRLGLLVAGSSLAAAAYLVRQLGVVLPLAAALAFIVNAGWREALRPRHLLAILGPLVPSLLLYAYFDSLRGPGRLEPATSALAFWAYHGPGMVGVVLARLAGAFMTLGLFTLPLSLGILARRPPVCLRRPQTYLAGALVLALVFGGVVHVFKFGEKRIFPATWSMLSARGFELFRFGARSPDLTVVPEWAMTVVAVASVFGAALLVLALAAALNRRSVSGPPGAALLYGPLALGMSISFVTFNDRYSLVLLPSALLVTSLASQQGRWRYGVALAGVVFMAAWGISWERDYWARRVALWQMGLSLGEVGIPPQEIDGGYEWNGWFRGEPVIAAGAALARESGWWGSMNAYVNERLHMSLNADPPRKTPWIVALASPAEASRSRVIAAVPHGPGEWVVAVQRPPD